MKLADEFGLLLSILSAFPPIRKLESLITLSTARWSSAVTVGASGSHALVLPGSSTGRRAVCNPSRWSSIASCNDKVSLWLLAQPEIFSRRVSTLES